MLVLTEGNVPAGAASSPPRVRMRMLTQMAEALEDQAAGLYRRAAASEEEEFLLNREIEERQTDINRLVLKLEAMRAERERVMDRIEAISQEATAMREEVFNGEEEVALAGIEGLAAESSTSRAAREGSRPEHSNGNHTQGASFFRRMTLSEETSLS